MCEICPCLHPGRGTVCAGAGKVVENFRGALAVIAANVPRAIAGRLARLTTAGKKAKSHSFFLLAGPFGAYAVKKAGMPPRLEAAMLSIVNACSRLWDKVQRRSQLGQLRTAVVEAICLVERHMSATELDIKLHNLMHLVDGIEQLGEH